MLKQLPINTDNFLRFFDTATPTINDTKFIKTTNNGYDYKWRQFCFPLPIAVGDELNFYTNFSTNLVGSNSISIIVDNQIVVDATKYVLSVTSVGTNNKLISLSIPLASTGTRQKFSLGITFGASILYRSNDFYVIDRNDKSLNNTHLLKFFNNTNVFNYEWGDLDKEVDPYYTVRIPSSVYEFGYPKEDTIYKSATSGKPRKTRTVLSKSVVFESYFVDEELHDAVNYALNSNNLFINTKEFVMESGYEVAFNKNSNIHKGTATLLEKNYGARLNNCSPQVVTPEPEPEPASISFRTREIDGYNGATVDHTLSWYIDNVLQDTFTEEIWPAFLVKSAPANSQVRFDYSYTGGSIVPETASYVSLDFSFYKDDVQEHSNWMSVPDYAVTTSGTYTTTIIAGADYEAFLFPDVGN